MELLHCWLFIKVSNLGSQIKVKHRLRVSKNAVQRKIFELKGSNKRQKISYQENSSFTPHQILLR
jgi:hypothetical protein